MTFTIWFDIENEAVGFPVICHIVVSKFPSGGSTLFLVYLHYSAV